MRRPFATAANPLGREPGLQRAYAATLVPPVGGRTRRQPGAVDCEISRLAGDRYPRVSFQESALMPCLLKPSSTGNEDFLVVTGQTVTIALTGSNAKILHIRYGSDEIDRKPPYQFTSESGPKILTVLAEASKPGAVLHLEEVCSDGSRQKLKRFYYDPMSPARGYIIRGKQDV